MIVKLYSKFAKRNNSTKTPTGGVEYTGTLKDNCDILNPVVIFQAAPGRLIISLQVIIMLILMLSRDIILLLNGNG